MLFLWYCTYFRSCILMTIQWILGPFSFVLTVSIQARFWTFVTCKLVRIVICTNSWLDQMAIWNVFLHFFHLLLWLVLASLWILISKDYGTYQWRIYFIGRWYRYAWPFLSFCFYVINLLILVISKIIFLSFL